MGQPASAQRVGAQLTSAPLRPAWVEVDLGQLRKNFRLIHADKPSDVAMLSVVKDNAYGHGALTVARCAIDVGAKALAVSNLDEALHLRHSGIVEPILIFGTRPFAELPCCLEYSLIPCVDDLETAERLNALAAGNRRRHPVHLEIDTGMSRYGIRWDTRQQWMAAFQRFEWLELAGVMSHFAMSDELDKHFALLQLDRFRQCLDRLNTMGIRAPVRHLCNSGGFLDLPEAHFDLVRLGILPLGVYPSKVCRRIPGVSPVMTVKSKIMRIQNIQKGDSVGYGMRYRAPSKRRIGVMPIGYGDGFPRVRNQGEVLIHGQRTPIVGANAMDATMVDLTGLPDAREGDDVVIQGRQKDEVISVDEMAALKGTVSYEVLCGWRLRLPRIEVDHSTQAVESSS